MRIAHILAVATMAAAGPVWSQMTGVTRADLLKEELSVPGREVSQVRVDFAPGVVAQRHSHPGEEVAYVLEGTLEYRIDNQAPVTLKAGQTLFIPAGAVHTAKNVGNVKASELATYILEKGMPQVQIAK